jgi:hypothetical protein
MIDCNDNVTVTTTDRGPVNQRRVVLKHSASCMDTQVAVRHGFAKTLYL